jgi:hypothetical protein
MKGVNRGFVIGSIISIAGFLVLGFFYMLRSPLSGRLPAGHRGFP